MKNALLVLFTRTPVAMLGVLLGAPGLASAEMVVLDCGGGDVTPNFYFSTSGRTEGYEQGGFRYTWNVFEMDCLFRPVTTPCRAGTVSYELRVGSKKVYSHVAQLEDAVKAPHRFTIQEEDWNAGLDPQRPRWAYQVGLFRGIATVTCSDKQIPNVYLENDFVVTFAYGE